MDPQVVEMTDCIEHCPVTHPLTGAHCTEFVNHSGPHNLEHIERTVRWVRQNQITRFNRG